MACHCGSLIVFRTTCYRIHTSITITPSRFKIKRTCQRHAEHKDSVSRPEEFLETSGELFRLSGPTSKLIEAKVKLRALFSCSIFEFRKRKRKVETAIGIKFSFWLLAVNIMTCQRLSRCMSGDGLRPKLTKFSEILEDKDRTKKCESTNISMKLCFYPLQSAKYLVQCIDSTF